MLTLSLFPFGPFLFKGTMQESINSTQNFSIFLTVMQLPVTFLAHTHNILTLCPGAAAQF